MIITITMIIIAYFIGSISSAVLLCRYFQLPDPRSQGSGNAGATNVLRQSNHKVALMVLAADAFKGFFAVGLASALGVGGMGIGFVALAAVVGHIFPFFFNFKGGKGVATALGVLFPISWLLAVLVILIWVSIVALYRYVSLASTTASLAIPIGSLLLAPHCFIPFVLITALILWKHKDNIRRLQEGVEPKIDLTKFKKKDQNQKQK